VRGRKGERKNRAMVEDIVALIWTTVYGQEPLKLVEVLGQG
jgi:hypothetical protein